MTNTTPILERATGTAPQSIDGEPLNPNSLHDWLCLPIQHFMDRHPEKTREQLVREVCEIVAELIGSSTPHLVDARRLGRMAADELRAQVDRKFRSFERLRQSN
jgi:hypothetical protein